MLGLSPNSTREQTRSAFNETTKSSSVFLSRFVSVCESVSEVVLWCYCGLSLFLSQAKKLCSQCYTVFIVASLRSSNTMSTCTHTRTLRWISGVWEAGGTSPKLQDFCHPKAITWSFWQNLRHYTATLITDTCTRFILSGSHSCPAHSSRWISQELHFLKGRGHAQYVIVKLLFESFSPF